MCRHRGPSIISHLIICHLIIRRFRAPSCATITNLAKIDAFAATPPQRLFRRRAVMKQF